MSRQRFVASQFGFVSSWIELQPAALLSPWSHGSAAGDGLYIAVYVALQLGFFFVFGFWIAHLRLPIASAIMLLCEQVRMGMKMHSFVRETFKIR